MMNLKAVTVAVLFSSLLARPASGQDAQAERTFRAWDKDKSDSLTPPELPQNARRNFAKADRDGNGKISLAEHLAYLSRRQPPSRKQQLPDSVRLEADVPYADTSNSRQALDLLLPTKRSEKPLPLIAFIHGGGWKSGNKESGIRRVVPFVASGNFVGASIGYRLSGEAQWPSQIHDCKAAIRWLKANADKYNIDSDRICVFGTSAGGHLVAMLGVTSDVEDLEGDLGSNDDEDSRVAAVIDFFGPTNFLTMNDFPGKMDHDAPSSPESLLIGAPIQENKQKALAACPMKYVTSDDAPILILHGTKDPLVPYDQSVQFEKALTAAGVEVTLVEVKDAGHGFGGAEINRRVRQFIDKVLLEKKVDVSEEPINP